MSYRSGWLILFGRLFLCCFVFSFAVLHGKAVHRQPFHELSTHSLFDMLQSQTAGRSTRRKFIHTLPLLLHLVTRLSFWPEIHNSFLLEARDTRHIHNFCIWCPPQVQGTAVRNTGISRQKVLVWFLVSVRGLLCGRGCGFRRWRLLGQYQYWPSIPMPHPSLQLFTPTPGHTTS